MIVILYHSLGVGVAANRFQQFVQRKPGGATFGVQMVYGLSNPLIKSCLRRFRGRAVLLQKIIMQRAAGKYAYFVGCQANG